MKKQLLALWVAAACAPAFAASMDDLKISGFGSVALGVADTDLDYAGYSKDYDFKPDSLMGVQFDFQMNDRASAVMQVVANGRYDFEPSVEVAYINYELDMMTLQAGKMRSPFFMYSDYLDVGYAYPMLRPAEEIYNYLNVNNYTGVSAIIPFDIGDSVVQVQPFFGVSQLAERDSDFGLVDIHDVAGLTSTLMLGDWTLRGSYAQGKSGQVEHEVGMLISDKKATFASVGAQYNDGALLMNVEAMEMGLEGLFPDIQSFNVLFGYQIDSLTPYFSVAMMESSDNDERDFSDIPVFGDIFSQIISKNHERQSVSAGVRWDFAPKMAFKFDVTRVDYKDTAGGDLMASPDLFEETLVTTASVDFVF